MSDRYFKNDCKDGKNVIVEGKVIHSVQEKLEQLLENLLITVGKGDIQKEKHDISVYSGRAGLALLYFHLYKLTKESKYIELAVDHISYCRHKLSNRRVTFLCGDAGILALVAVIYNEVPDRKHKVEKYVKKLIAMIPEIIDLNTNLPDELLYGRSGFLYALLFVNKYLENCIANNDIISVWKIILESGMKKAEQSPETCPLMYEWHGKKYIGAAHGLSGIIYMLLQVETTETRSFIHSHVQPMVDYILDLQFPSGNYPSSLTNDNDRLVHWCHGAPGVVHLMIAAHKIFKDKKYLKSAKKCCDIIWKKGLLKKGYGLCHGPAGNAYAFLAMFQHTNKNKYLSKAVHFALWCIEYKTRTGLNTPDSPHSMFQGLSGTAYFIADVLYSNVLANFPAFCL